MFCPNCGQKLADDETVCPHCGAGATDLTPPNPLDAGPEPETDLSEEVLGPDTPETEGPAEPLLDESPDQTVGLFDGGPEPTPNVPSDGAESVPVPEPAPGFNMETGVCTGSWGPYGEPTKPLNFRGEANQSEEAPAPPEKKSRKNLVSGIIIAVLAVLVVGLSAALIYVSSGGSLSDVTKVFHREKKVDGDNVALTVTDETGAEVGSLTNRQLCFYYWGEYYYYVNSYGFTFDASLPLDEQNYAEDTDSETGKTTVTTWEDYFMESAQNSYLQTAALKAQAQADGFQMPEDYQAEYDSVVEAMPTNAQSAGFTTDDGEGDVLAYIRDSYGDVATLEDFEDYLYDSYYVSAYSSEIYNGFTYDDQALGDYYDENADYFTAYGLEKSDVPNINVRHILIEPESDEDGNISDEAWDAAEEEAQEIYDQWQSGEATEESFGDLANEKSADGGSNTNGGLYESVYPGQMITEFNDWCFDESRQTGDTDIVRTDYGYHIMYFVGKTDEYYWKTAVESELRYKDYDAWMSDLTTRYTAALTKDADVADPDAVKQIQAQYAQQQSASTADDGAAG